MMHEERLKRYFEQESVQGDLSAQQWEDVLLHVKSQDQRRGIWRFVRLLTPRRPLLASAVTFVLLIVAGGTSLWVTAPWEGPSLEGPRAVRGLPSIPPPIILEQEWKVDKSLITPGDSITISLTLKNVWDKPIEIRELPATTPLTNVDRGSDEPVLLEWEDGGAIPHSIEPGDELTLVANMSSAVSAGLPPGRYGLRVQVAVVHAPGSPEAGESKLGFGGGRFVVIPPEGALDRTVIVDQVRETSGTKITLEKIHFAPEESTIVVLATPPPCESAEAQPITAPAPTATAIPQQGTPTPTAVPLPAGFDVDVTDLGARYRIDGGPWRQLRGHGYRVTAEGVHHEWTFGPVSANAGTLVLAIASDDRPGSEWLWEWTVALQVSQ